MDIEIKESDIKYFRQNLIKWGKDNFSDFSWRFTKNTWHSLVVEMMLQRTKAEQVVPVFNRFVEKYPTPKEYYEDKNSEVFKTLGLPDREVNLKKLAGILKDTCIPSDKNHLLKLPGIGPYIAGAYRSLHLELEDIIIDSNVVRLYGRYFGFETNPETRRKKWFINLTTILTPKEKNKIYNYAILDFTRLICKPKPVCNICVLRKKCEFFNS